MDENENIQDQVHAANDIDWVLKSGRVNKKQKRRVSDAKCRANISAGFSLLKKQVYKKFCGVLWNVSKEMVLSRAYVYMKYLEGILVALQHTKEHRTKQKKFDDSVSLAQQLKDIQRQFVACQQRKGCITVSNTLAPVQTVPSARGNSPEETHQEKDIRRNMKSRGTGSEVFKRSQFDKTKPSNIIHLPPTLDVCSKTQKCVKLASTEPGQDQVVPFSPILSPCKPPVLCPSKITEKPRQTESHQLVPASDSSQPPCRRSAMPWECTGVPRGKSASSWQDCEEDQIEDSGLHGRETITLDLACNEESSSWSDDDSSSGGSYPELPYCPLFSTPVHPTTTLHADKPPALPIKKRPFPRKRTKSVDTDTSPKSKSSRRRRLFKDNKKHPKEKHKCVRSKPRKRCEKQSTAARVHAWDPVVGCVSTPVQEYGGRIRSRHLYRKTSAKTTWKEDSFLASSPWQKKGSESDPALHRTPGDTNPGAKQNQHHQSSGSLSSSEEELDVDVVSVAEPELAKELSNSYSDDSLSSDICLKLDSPGNHDPLYLQDVSIPPPSGTISPLQLPRSASTPTSFDASPELFQSLRGRWLQTSDGYQQLLEDPPPAHLSDCQYEESFYFCSPGRVCDLGADEKGMMLADSVDDLFEADLGDVRHLDPALQPPSSFLDSGDCSVWLGPHELEKPKDAHITGGQMTDDSMARASPTPRTQKDGVITKALASFATSALQLPDRKARRGRRQGSIRLNLPQVAPAQSSEEDDLNIWKFTKAALNEKDVLRFLPSDSTYSFLSSN